MVPLGAPENRGGAYAPAGGFARCITLVNLRAAARISSAAFVSKILGETILGYDDGLRAFVAVSFHDGQSVSYFK